MDAKRKPAMCPARVRRVLGVWDRLPLRELLARLLAAWKQRVIAARRAAAVELEVQLNMAKAWILAAAKQLTGRCADCGVTVAPGTERCRMHYHAWRHRSGRKLSLKSCS